jgi:hypothetical protein
MLRVGDHFGRAFIFPFPFWMCILVSTTSLTLFIIEAGCNQYLLDINMFYLLKKTQVTRF